MGAVKIITVIFVLCACLDKLRGEDIIISSPAGKIRGISSVLSFNGEAYNTTSFLGIPFAEPTGGARRFSKPVKKAKFVGIYNATEPKLACPQNVDWAEGLDQLPVSEDCLNLNIFVSGSGASQNEPKAVMIFIYGGGFQFGFQNSYISAALPALHGVVYVTINYRVSIYGFLANKKHGLKGNYGLWDQHLAIQWVHDNIAAFGGDPGRVTLFGESAGAVAAMYQALYKGNKGLVHRVIAESGVVGADFAYSKYPDESFEDLSKRSGCDKETFDETVECLKATDADVFKGLLRYENNFSPVQDGEFIDYDPESFFINNSLATVEAIRNYADVDVVIGFNSDEGLLELNLLAKVLRENITQFSDGMSVEKFNTYVKRFFSNINITSDDRILKSVLHQYTDWMESDNKLSRRSMFMNLLKDFYYKVPAVQALNLHLNTDAKGDTYMYYFDHKPSFSISPNWVKGADHTEEIPFVLGFPSLYMFVYDIYSEDPAQLIPTEEVNLSMAMMKYWTQFAKTGNPNDATDNTLAYWPQYNATDQLYLHLRSDEITVPSKSHFRDEFNYWTEIFPELLKAIETVKRNDTIKCYITSAGALALPSVHTAFTILTSSLILICVTFLC